jgi:dTMP kinase
MANERRGRFIVLEGGEGAGKSTQAKAVVDWLRMRGREVIQTREPGGSPLAEAIRDLSLRDWSEGVAPMTELLLMFAARSAHLHARIAPALTAGTDVVSDRFVDASYAYQGVGRGLGSAPVAALETLVVGDLRPDLVVVLDIDPREGLRRTKRRGDENRFEAETMDFLKGVRQAYLDRAAAAPERYAVIDATPAAEQVRQSIIAALEDRQWAL